MPSMIQDGNGHIVSIASFSAYESIARCICYAASAYGIRGLMEGLSELVHIDRLNVNVTTVYPPLDPTNLTPREVAIGTVNGILKNQQHVVLPAYVSPIANVLQ